MTDSPTRVPLCVNGMIPALSDPHVLTALAGQLVELDRTTFSLLRR